MISYFNAAVCTGVGGAFPPGDPNCVFVPIGPDMLRVALAGLALDLVGEGGRVVVNAVSARMMSLIPKED